MAYSFFAVRRILAAAALVAAGTLVALPTGRALGDDAGLAVKPVIAQKLPNVPGKTSYAPGGKPSADRHAGSVFAYVLSGSIRSENSATVRSRRDHPGRTPMQNG